jgi:hypothetical protein
MSYPSDEDRFAISWTIFFLAVVSAIVLLAGCGEARTPAEPVSPIATIGQLGLTLTWVGGICAAAGIALRIIALVYPPLAGLGAVFGFLAIGGASVTATGCSIQWLADNPVVMVAAIVVSTGAVVYWYWPRLHRAWDRRMDGKV